MPELPEVEIIRLQLDQKLKGFKITDIEVLTSKSFVGHPEKVIGRKILGVSRRAKITLIELEGGLCLAIHLKLTGQLVYSSKGGGLKGCAEKEDSPFKVCELPNKFTRVIISFADGGKLYFNDLRIFGWVKVISDIKEVGGEKFGPEANDEKAFTLEYFQSLLQKTKKPVKLVILDQEKLAGVGNIYANESLFQAGIMPTRPSNSLSEDEVRKLRLAIIEVLNEAIKYKGTSDRDEAYRQITGEKGEFQNHLQVYGKTGKPCPQCSGKVERINLGGRGTFFCRQCQK